MTDIYTANGGDTWDLISYRVYGTEVYAHELLAANPEYRELAFLSGGEEIVCPDIDLPVATTLPPWRR